MAHVTTAEMERIAEETFAVIERDSDQKLNERMRKVLKHWMVDGMQEVRNKTLTHMADVLDRAAEEAKTARLR